MLKKILILFVVLGFCFVIMLLTTAESQFEVRSRVHLDASSSEVWQVLIAVEKWPDWWPGMEDAQLVETLQAGGQIHLQLKGEPDKVLALLTQVSAEHELTWESPGVLGSRAGTSLRLEGDSAGSNLTIKNSVRGPQAFLARITGEDAFALYQQKLLEKLGLFLRAERAVAGEKD